MSPSNYGAVLRFVPLAIRRGQEALNPAFPRKYRDLVKRHHALAPIPLEREFLWAANRIAQFGEKLNVFLALKSKVELALLEGNPAIAEAMLDEIESEFGTSFFLIETRLAVLQQHKGLEQQKSYCSVIRESNPRGIVPFIAFWISQKNEFATNPLLFPDRFHAELERTGLDQDITEYLAFKILGGIPKIDRASNILRWAQACSLIDHYEAMIATMIGAVSKPALIEPALRLLDSAVTDERLNRLQILVGRAQVENSAFDSHQLTIQSELEFGNPGRAFGLGQEHTGSINPLLLILEAYARADLDKPVKGSYTNVSRDHLIALFVSVIAKSEDYEEAVFSLLRILNCFPAFRFSTSVRPALLRVASTHPRAQLNHLLPQFINAQFVDPLVLQVLPMQLRATLIDGLAQHGYQHASELNRFSGDDNSSSAFDGEISFVYAVESALAHQRDDVLLELTELTPTNLPLRIRREMIRNRIHAKVALSKIPEALDEIASAYVTDPAILMILPITDCMEALEEDGTEELSGDLPLAIVSDLYLRYFGDDRPFIRSDAYEDFLLAHGCERPSEMTAPPGGIRLDYFVYYLRFVCAPEVMLSSGAYTSSKEVEDERLKVLLKLKDLDTRNAEVYDSESRDITRQQIISEGLRHVEQSKFVMDVQPLRRWAEKNLKESFARYQALKAAGVKAIQSVDIDSTDETTNIPDTPLNEPLELIHEMLSRFLTESFTNSFHGLDPYLSMRARHGSFAGQLRAPLEEENIITLRDGVSDEYKSNTFWMMRLDASIEFLQEVDEILRAFSKTFDLAVKDFADSRLQIKSAEKPVGLFGYTVASIDLILLFAESNADTPFGAFVDQCFQIFWANVESSLTRVRESIDSELRVALSQQIIDLVSSLEEKKVNAEYVDDLITSVRSAQTKVQYSIEGLKEWFHTPKPVSPRIFTIDEIVDISIEQVKRQHPDFDPVVTKDIPQDFVVLQLTRFADVFSIIFENVQRHSGVGSSPSISVKVRGNNPLEIEVNSEMEIRSETEHKLQEIRDVIAADKYHKIVRSEGGTGLVKLWNQVRLDNAHLEFGVSGDRFRVFISMPMQVFEQTSEETNENSPSGR